MNSYSMDEYPERRERQKMLERICLALEEEEQAGGLGGVNIGIEQVMNLAESEDISAARGVRLFQQLHREGYFDGRLGSLFLGSYWRSSV
jgi:hypothetical protein